MNTINNRKLIISLIKDDLIHNKLISGLENIGLESSDYRYELQLSETIFMLIGFKMDEKNDRTFEFYLSQLKHADSIHITKLHEILDALAQNIYTKLKRRANAK